MFTAAAAAAVVVVVVVVVVVAVVDLHETPLVAVAFCFGELLRSS